MSKKTKNETRVGRRRKKIRKRIYMILAFVLTIFLAVSAYGIHLYIQAEKALTEAHDGKEREKSDLRDEVVDPKVDNVSILIMGVDSSDKRENEETARTDTLMVATLNKDDKS